MPASTCAIAALIRARRSWLSFRCSLTCYCKLHLSTFFRFRDISHQSCKYVFGALCIIILRYVGHAWYFSSTALGSHFRVLFKLPPRALDPCYFSESSRSIGPIDVLDQACKRCPVPAIAQAFFSTIFFCSWVMVAGRQTVEDRVWQLSGSQEARVVSVGMGWGEGSSGSLCTWVITC